MPLVEVELIEGVFTDQQKSRMIEKLTDAMVSIKGENMRSVTFVTIEEVRSGDWGIRRRTPAAGPDGSQADAADRPSGALERSGAVLGRELMAI